MTPDRRPTAAALLAALHVAFALLAACAGGPASGTTRGGLFYEVTGDGDPVILLHGFSLDRRMWDGQSAVLEGGHRVIRYDLRGHGRSAAPDAPYSNHDDLLTVYETLGVPKAALVGLSAGAQAAVDFALAHPDRVTRLVLASPGLSGYRPEGSFEWMAGVFESIRAGDFDEGARRWAETPLMKIQGDPEAHAKMREIVLANAGVWSLRSNPVKPAEPPAIDRLSAIRVPTLVILGERDLPDTRRVADLLAAGIQGARKISVPGAGHLVNMEAPAVFNDALTEFLRGGG